MTLWLQRGTLGTPYMEGLSGSETANGSGSERFVLSSERIGLVWGCWESRGGRDHRAKENDERLHQQHVGAPAGTLLDGQSRCVLGAGQRRDYLRLPRFPELAYQRLVAGMKELRVVPADWDE